ncbi:hypothetical protein MPF_1843 [Methanohalophilus portucalensis FDF-1]|uniref:Uncharacterized protein n=1 Tax=Methanohalophilus portucalensis FDF-1 TaxID=523843 RepID=A0A1L9C249_9EURY|nr:hypothetical protein MPF_1843 [Methanohalophilus portucalensis FDF-1]
MVAHWQIQIFMKQCKVEGKITIFDNSQLAFFAE